jgi:hypothetical protein
LSLQLGIPEEELAARLTNRSFERYRHYAARHLLPTRRIQLQLAQLTMWTAMVAGHKDGKVGDFLIGPTDEEEQEQGEQDLDVMRAEFGFKPIQKKTE